jgi:hypothetical protein
VAGTRGRARDPRRRGDLRRVDVGGQRSATAVAWVTADLRAGVWIGHGDDAFLEARDVIRDLAERYTVIEIAFDPWRAGQLADELEREASAASRSRRATAA